MNVERDHLTPAVFNKNRHTTGNSITSKKLFYNIVSNTLVDKKLSLTPRGTN
jgi:hypothetical protein